VHGNASFARSVVFVQNELDAPSTSFVVRPCHAPHGLHELSRVTAPGISRKLFASEVTCTLIRVRAGTGSPGEHANELA
jgi:hypothetical protein